MPINPLYQRATFITSAAHFAKSPPDTGWEVAFAGRSNVGKSSALNTIAAQKGLARVSKTPGRTQLLNFFALDDFRRLVDLPGYGYAAVPGKLKDDWGRLVEGYLSRRQSLRGVLLLMDIRHPLMPFDRQMLNWCRHNQLRLHVLLTKADKLGYGAATATLKRVGGELNASGVTETSAQLFSATKRTGIEEAHAILDRWLEVGTDIPTDSASAE